MKALLKWAAAAAITAITLTASACGGGSSSDSPGPDGTVKLRVTTLPLCEDLARYATVAGLFKAKGIEVEPIPTTGGSAGTAALQSNSADVGFITATAALGAMSNGVDLTFVSGGVRTSPKSNGVVVKQDSPIRGPRDLVGKKVGVLELAGSGSTAVNSWVQKATGSDPGIKFVQLPFPELVPAVLNGTIDAAQVTASEVFTLKEAGTGRTIGNASYEAVGGSVPQGMYVVTTDFLAKHPDTMKKFVAVMQEAADTANNPADTQHFEAMSQNCKKPAADLAKIPTDGRPAFEGYIDRVSYKRLVDSLRQSKTLPEGFDANTKVADFAWAKN